MNWACLLHGHNVQKVDGSKQNLAFQKGGKRQVIDYYNGLYEYCDRPGCDWNRYIGIPRAYRREILGAETGGTKNEKIQSEGTQTHPRYGDIIIHSGNYRERDSSLHAERPR